MKHPILLGLALTAVTLPFSIAAPLTTDLFNGKDLTGWIQRGGKASYTVENNEIVGTSVPNSPNSFLCTSKSYGDFTLEYEFKIDPKLNSGVQFRSECFEEARKIVVDGKTVKVPAGRVHGYQAEIDPDPIKDRWWSAGIYDEGRRSWLYPGKKGGDAAAFTKQGRGLFKQNDWNQVKIEARGDSIKTYLNGTLRAEIKDSQTLNGFIALQVHGIGKDKSKVGLQVRWRNLKIQTD